MREASSSLVRVKAFPGARKEKLIKTDADSFEIYVREPAQKNMANTRVRELIAAHFSVPINHVHIEKGHHSRSKIIRITL